MRKSISNSEKVRGWHKDINPEVNAELMHRLGIATEEERARIELWSSSLANERFLVEEEKLGDLALNRVLDKLERYGICQIRPVGLPSTHELVESIIHLIGSPAEYQNEAVGRIKDIRPSAHFKANTGNSTGDLGLHVDGTQTSAQPVVLLFQYVTGATFGAHSRFADAARILHDFSLNERSRLLRKLSMGNAATFVKGNRCLVGPIFDFSPAGTLMCRIRFDDVITVNNACIKEYRKLSNAVKDPYYSIVFQPRDGDIILVDNWRILHARTAVLGTRDRHHRRVWFTNLKLELQPRYYLGIRPISRALIAQIHNARSA